MTRSLGLSCVYGERPPVDEIVRLLTDARWPWQPQLMSIGNVAGGALTPQVKGKIPIANLAAAVHDAFSAQTASHVMLTCSKQQALNHAWVRVQTGNGSRHHKVPFDLMAVCRAEALPAGKSIEAWIDLAHDLVRAVRAVHGVIVVTRNDDHVSDEVWLTTTIRNGKLVHEFAAEIQRAESKRFYLGAKYVRAPRWGTYLPAWAVEAVGGYSAIEAKVAPAIAREVGETLYVQLSARVDDALAPEAEAKRRALADLLAPITTP
ncbi:MAG TPA: hypothetical protein VL463_18075 [Kofleriaceae bacterium]|nr:hypothetical protein [Kofleriaceae bacterium]